MQKLIKKPIYEPLPHPEVYEVLDIIEHYSKPKGRLLIDDTEELFQLMKSILEGKNPLLNPEYQFLLQHRANERDWGYYNVTNHPAFTISNAALKRSLLYHLQHLL